jgi:hypothetical protein
MIFMWLIFIQVRSANIMSMLYLHNVRGDWINIYGVSGNRLLMVY